MTESGADESPIPAEVLLPGMTFSPLPDGAGEVRTAFVMIEYVAADGEKSWCARQSLEDDYNWRAVNWQLHTFVASEVAEEVAGWKEGNEGPPIKDAD